MEDLWALCPVESVINPQKSPLAIYLPQPDGTSYISPSYSVSLGIAHKVEYLKKKEMFD